MFQIGTLYIMLYCLAFMEWLCDNNISTDISFSGGKYHISLKIWSMILQIKVLTNLSLMGRVDCASCVFVCCNLQREVSDVESDKVLHSSVRAWQFLCQV